MSDAVVLLGIVIVLLIAWIVDVHKMLVFKEEACRSELAHVGVQQEARWDVLSQLNALTKGYTEHEFITIERAIQSRKMTNTDFTSLKSIEEQESCYRTILNNLNAVVEAYPNIKANELFMKHMETLTFYENTVTESKYSYNLAVRDYNYAVRVFPTCIVASQFKFKEKKYISSIKDKRDIALYS